MRVVKTVDPGSETPDWNGQIGSVPHAFEQASVPAANSVALVIGSPIMIKNPLPVLGRMGIAPGDTTRRWRTA